MTRNKPIIDIGRTAPKISEYRDLGKMKVDRHMLADNSRGMKLT